MKIKKIEVKNYRSLRDVTIHTGNLLAIIGRNNSGKSNIIKALEILFKGSIKLIDKECFYNHDVTNDIEIFVTFDSLSAWENKEFAPWMDNEELVVGRVIRCVDSDTYNMSNIAVIRIPEHEWLQERAINGDKISEWWVDKDKLKIGTLDFGSKLGSTKPTVSKWKQISKQFIEDNRDNIPCKKEKIDNPKGYPGVLKGALPEFIHIPAVRDVGDEIKVAKTNPFGQLINSILEKITDEKKEILTQELNQIKVLLNRSEEGGRLDEIRGVENRFNELMKELMDCDVEIQMNMPSLKEVFGGAKIFVNDGVRTPIDAKGHGMQRSMIFTILRAYAELSHVQKAGEESSQRTTLFAIEEPEIYLHPQSQRTLSSVFQKISRSRDQIIFSSQSSLFIDISHFDQICIMKQEKHEECFESIPTQLPISKMIEDLKLRKGVTATEESIREHYSHVFNPFVNEGFFADKIVIVEGPSELYLLPIYADAIGYNLNRNNVSIVHTDGKGQMDRLLRVFSGFQIPTYLWFDGDKDSKEKAVRKKTLELLEMLENPLDNFDNLKTEISGKYTVLEYNLEKLLHDEIPNYEAITQKAAEILGPTGKPLKHRFIAKYLKQQVDGGESPDKVIPKSILTILDKIRNL